ncbi:hypothetical protein D9Q98_002174 [Chlorella vulgaris]|uniref:Uncharacterized protein n=1 Tax=Chlorella vulgaris TaxID=3077 RepID=A0A9D4TW68_CHLVU|nr:hypothetical protein D9Q98_002174 [Chlorella vulgaris]
MKAPRATLALIACVLVAAAAIVDGRKLEQWVPVAGGTSGPTLRTTVNIGFTQVPCLAFSPLVQDWTTSNSPTLYTATGNTRPPFNETEDLISRICQDPLAAGTDIASAVQAGGQEAQTALVALLSADCPPNNEAGPASYSAAIDQVNPSGDPADLDEVSSWFTNLAAAADDVGVPLCASIAVVDPTGGVVEAHTFHTSGIAAPAAESGSASPERVRTSAVFGQEGVTCDVYDSESDSWVINTTAPVYGTSGSANTPPATLVAALGDQVCNDPLAAGPLLRDAVQAGGEQAQLWTYALLNLGPNCPDPSALSMAYSVAIGGINDGTTDSLDATTEWFTNLAAAGDAVGNPLCASLAIINEATGEVEQRDFHTGGEEGA